MPRWFVPACMAWLGVVAAGFSYSRSYEVTAGASMPVALVWPRDAQLPHHPGAPALVIFVHPDCPCSRASLDELNAVLQNAPGRLEATAVFESSEASGTLWKRAGELPGLHRVLDDGHEARSFGAETSGHAFFYDATGALLFSGGITSARGHEGDNVGREELLARVSNREASRAPDHAVFGCSLSGMRSAP